VTLENSITGVVLLALIMAAPELLVLPFAVVGAAWEIVCSIFVGKRGEP
jgi:Ca2+/Na+ antiporter